MADNGGKSFYRRSRRPIISSVTFSVLLDGRLIYSFIVALGSAREDDADSEEPSRLMLLQTDFGDRLCIDFTGYTYGATHAILNERT